MFVSVGDQIQQNAEETPDAVALLSPDETSLTFRDLQRRVNALENQLRESGFQKGNRIAIVLPNGIDHIISLLALWKVCTAVPLNPSSPPAELKKLYEDLGIDGVITSDGLNRRSKINFREDRSVGLLMMTSGTTDRQKIVPLTQTNIAVSAKDFCAALLLDSKDRCLNLMPLFHRSGISAVICSLFAGGSVVIPAAFSASHFFEWVDHFKPTWYTGSPAMHRSILTRSTLQPESARSHQFRFIRSSSSPISITLVDEMERTFGTRVIQTYSTTETGLIAATRVDHKKSGSVGCPVSGIVAILNDKGDRCNIGQPGRVAVKGENVISGYENGADHTSFVDGWFLTGDIAYLDADNDLFLVGRTTDAINRGGQKVSPAEVEAVLLQHPAVAEAAVFSLEDPELGETVRCAVALHPGKTVSELEIQNFAADYLVNYKIPARVAFCPALPRSPTGKIDRTVLRNIAMTPSAPDPGQLKEVEEKLLTIWKSVIGIDEIGMRDRFFQAGGDSLMATQLVNRIQDAFDVPLSIRTVFESSTIQEQALYLMQAVKEKRPLIERLPGSAQYPLSFNQERLWFLHQLAPASPVYNIAKHLRMKGPLNVENLVNAFKTIVHRHESLRTRFISVDGVPYQFIDEPDSFDVQRVDYSHLDEDEIQQRIDYWARLPFDLQNELSLRAYLVRRSDEDHHLVLVNHHIVSDRWSSGLFFQELATLYRNDRAVEPTIQYRDFADYQRKRMEDGTLRSSLEYWTKKLADPPLLSLKGHWPALTPGNFDGAKEATVFPRSLVERVQLFCKQEEVTPFMFYMTALQSLLYRYAGQTDITVGTPISGRFTTQSESLLGFFANTIVIRGDLSGSPAFRNFLLRIRQNAIDAFEHQEVPFEKVVEAVNPPRASGHFPLFDVVLTFTVGSPKLQFEELTIEMNEVYTGTAKFPLQLILAEAPDGLHAAFTYNRNLFQSGEIRQMLRHFGILLEAALEQPEVPLSMVPLLLPDERNLILNQWSKSVDSCQTDTTIHAVFERIVQQMPDQIAVRSPSGSLTYRELNGRANAIASHLREAGVIEGCSVGIAMPRSADTVAGLLGILKTGAAYVPIDPDDPKERMDDLLKQACVKTWLTHENWPALQPRDECILEKATRPDSLCYILYTSGSTGAPKGVGISHRGVIRVAQGLDFLRLSSKDRILQHSSLSFDASTFEIWGALLNGGCLVIPGKKHLSLQELGKEIVEHHITTLWLTSPLFTQMVDDQIESLRSVRNLLAGGDVLSAAHVIKAHENLPSTTIINGYGPTECTTFACCHVMAPDAGSLSEQDGIASSISIPIGRPIANTSVYVLDSHLQPVAVGITGQLYIGGDGLAVRYINDERLTHEKFIQNPFGEGRLYATGDLVRWLPDSKIDFVGRSDQQIKVRGFRVEPGEIEFVIRKHSSVKDCVVVARIDEAKDKTLLAYVIPHQEFEPEALLAFLRLKLPSYMIPARIVSLDSFPLTSAGKVDRKKLPAPSTARSTSKRFVPPTDSTERQLVQIWEKLLNVTPVGITDDFFDLGGHSLLAVTLFSRIEKITGKSLPLATLFEAPAIRELAAILREQVTLTESSSAVEIQPLGNKTPFFCIHGVGGNVLNYRNLAHAMGTERPFYGVQSAFLTNPDLSITDLHDLASFYVAEISRLYPDGPYYIGGASFGGIVAFEIGRQLLKQKKEVAIVAILDTSVPKLLQSMERTARLILRTRRLFKRAEMHARNMLIRSGRLNYVRSKVKTIQRRANTTLWQRRYDRAAGNLPSRLKIPQEMHRNYLRKYQPEPCDLPVVLFRAADRNIALYPEPTLGWSKLANHPVEVVIVPGNHLSMLEPPNVSMLAAELNARLDRDRK